MDLQKQIEAYIDAHRADILAQWEALVNLEGLGTDLPAMDEAAAHLERLFTQAGFACTLTRGAPQAPYVLTATLGAGRPGRPVVFGGHYDTVFARGTFGPKPFRIDDEGKAHGPGCLDMKGGIIIALYAAKALETAGFADRPIRVILCGDEEGTPTHVAHSVPLMAQAAQGAVAAFNMETAPVDNALCFARKGAIVGNFTVHGVSAHSGNNFTVGRSAIAEAAYKMVAIHEMTDLEAGVYTNVGIVKGGTVWSQVPDYCHVDFSVRFSTKAGKQQTCQAIDALMHKTFIDGTTTEYEITNGADPFEENPLSPKLLAFMNRVAARHGWPAHGGIALGGGSDAGALAQEGVAVLCSCGVRGEWNHTDREYAVVESMFQRAKLLAAAVAELDDYEG